MSARTPCGSKQRAVSIEINTVATSSPSHLRTETHLVFETCVLLGTPDDGQSPETEISYNEMSLAGTFEKLQKTIINFMSVCLSVRPPARPHGSTRLSLEEFL